MQSKRKIKVLAVGCAIDLTRLEPVISGFDLVLIASSEDMSDRYADTEVLIWNNKFQLDEAMLQPLRRLKYIINWGTNSNNISEGISASERYELFLINDYAIQAVARYGFNLLIERLKQQPDPKPMTALKVGFIGFGKIGFRLADILEDHGVKSVLYNATADKHLDSFKFASQDHILNSCDFVFVLTSSPEPISLIDVNNPNLALVNLCSNDLFSTSELDNALFKGRMSYLLSDTNPVPLKSRNAQFFGHVAYKSPQSIVNKHNKLVYFLKRIRMNQLQTPELLYFVRHGETEWNRDGIYQGRLDSPMTPLGTSQTERAAGYLADKAIRHVFTSPIPRAKASAMIIGAALGIKPRVYGFLREQDFGALQGTPKAAAKQKYAGFFEGRTSSEWNKLYTPYPGGGESYYDVYHRIHDPYLELLTKLEGDAVFVGHESINRILRGFARDIQPAEMIDYRQANDELVTLDLESGAETVIRP